MLVTFNSKASGNITYLGDIAVTLLKLMGHSGTVPGALLAAAIPAAITRLHQGLAATAPESQGRQKVQPDTGGTDTPPPVGLRLRASPLIQLLSAAARQGCDVMWEKGAPPV